MSLTDLTIKGALEGLKKKEFSAVELNQAHIDAMAKHKELNCFITETADHALTQAAESDKRYASGNTLELDGIPLGIKDIYCTKGIRTTVASRMLENFVPTYESTVTSQLLAAGATCLGKLNLDEFAMGCSNETSYFGNVISPWKSKSEPNKQLVPGGSSGGSAAAVAARLCMGATGTDTGGSIRQPAALTGIVGMKPTYGRCSRWGIVAFASSLDQAGMFARTVEDTALLMNHACGHDEKDSTSSPRDVPDFTKSVGQSIKGLRVGIPDEYRIDGLPAEITAEWDKGIEWLRSEGAEIVRISLPHTKYALPTYYIINPAEASSNLARYDGVRYGLRVDDGGNLDEMYEKTRAAGFGPEVRRRIMVGTYALSAGYYDAYYIKAQKARRLILQDFEKAYEKCDFILTPPAPSAAFGIGEQINDPIQMYLNDVFTVTVNLAGLPGLTVPTSLNSDGRPLGLQLIGRSFDEETLFRAGAAIERCANFKAHPFKGDAA
jgi:aspartyl-tRNA(Asn)/glutamyl-tRNA(Gln) amidotransferase subunit A